MVRCNRVIHARRRWGHPQRNSRERLPGPARCAGGSRAEHRRAQGGRLRRTCNGNRPSRHVRVDLHQHGVTGEAASGDDRCDRQQLVRDRLYDCPCPKRGRFDDGVEYVLRLAY